MLTEKLHDAQADFTNSTDLGALIDQSEQRPEKINEIVIGFLVTGMIFGGLFATEHGWKGFCLGMFFPALGIATSVVCLLYTSPSPRDKRQSRMPSSA